MEEQLVSHLSALPLLDRANELSIQVSQGAGTPGGAEARRLESSDEA